MVNEEQTNGRKKAGGGGNNFINTVNDKSELKYQFKCEDCPLRFDSVSQHMERLLRQSAQGKVKESEALQSHWRDYLRGCKFSATPFCPACNVHFAGFMKLCQHVVRRVDYEENTTPPEVKKELDRLAEEVKKQKQVTAVAAVTTCTGKIALSKLDDDAVIPADSNGHRDVFNLIVEFLCGISDDMVTTDYQMELLTQVICSRSQPKWSELHLKKGDCDTMQHVNDDFEGMDNEDEEDEKEDEKSSEVATVVKSTNVIKDTMSTGIKKDEKNVTTAASSLSTSNAKGFFRCLAKGCNKEFSTLKEHIEEVIFTPLKTASSKDMDIIHENRKNHLSALFSKVKEPDFSNLSMSLCSVCGVHFRSLRCGAFNGLLNHLSMTRRMAETKNDDASCVADEGERLAAHVELHEWLLDQLVECAAGRSSHQMVADAICARVVCDQGGSIMDLGECGEIREAIATRRKERNQLTKKRKRDVLLRKKSVPKLIESRRDSSFGRGGGGPLSKRPRGARNSMTEVRRNPMGAGGNLRGGIMSLRDQSIGARDSANGSSLVTIPTCSAECSLCTTRFNGRTQQQAEDELRRHLMDTLFGARVGRTGAEFPPHRYWHQVAPISRLAYCPQCDAECPNLDALAQHLAVVIDGDNNPLSRKSHVVVARSIVDKFVDHMSGSLSVEGLREAMARFARPDSRLGSTFSAATGAGANNFSRDSVQQARILRDEPRSFMNQRPNLMAPREREFSSGLGDNSYRRSSDDLMSSQPAFNTTSEATMECGGEYNRQGVFGVRGIDDRGCDLPSSFTTPSRNSISNLMSIPAGGGIGGGGNLAMRNKNVFTEPLQRKGNLGSGGGWTSIASTSVRRF